MSGAWGIPSSRMAEERWHVLHVKPRQEQRLALELDAMGVEHFLPMSRVNGGSALNRPLFPGYLFLHGSMDDAYRADRTRRVVQLLRVFDQHQLAEDLRRIRLAVEASAPLAPHAQLAKGAWVEVIGGPLVGLRGIVGDVTRSSRLLLNVNLIGQSASLEIDASLLRPIDPRQAETLSAPALCNA